ncbi:hypothetical protein BRC73_06415 [Halobacteriales archaeon QH_7_66_37]|nr:MAG: hypothetical protein BRC73_06415 [Halobacteriales archaeon QH_7_66_37]
MDGVIGVVYVDDEPGFADLAPELLEGERDRLSVESVTSADRALDRLDGDVDCVVSDYDMPGTNGLELLGMVRGACPDLPFILFTGKGSEEIASEAISAGVTNYLQKEGSTEQFAVLANSIENAVTKHRAVAALETERDRFSVLFENAPDAIAFYEFDGEEPIVRMVNPTFQETFGYDSGAAVEESLDEIVVPAAYADEGRSINRRVRSGDRVDTEVTRQTADGLREFRLRSVPIQPGEHGERGYVIYHDITEQTDRKRELVELETALETLLSNVPVVFYAFDADGVFTRSQGQALEGIGFEPGEAVGESVFDLYDHRPEIIEHCERALDGERVNATVEIGGRTFEAWYQPLREDGEVVGVVGHKYDVTEYR